MNQKVVIKKGRKPLHTDKIPQVIELFKQGKPMRHIAKIVGISAPTVRRLLDNAGITEPSKGK
ncbi:helix-turn-helix domain-containing protein [Psychromonas sp. Urea-02u-13]|uniref:helix-turn-helix domain-containing protein n=1 Tax=Psychromonas sp. Urea-02u-13 TaxID=2058326 RepID=UPI000C3493DD|nr:helix-turn-helix domain-containing protein [Psychromonas sp. Urea-02u-13]PKG40210.1 hypothetical protein CXF74_03825 [Psychromonas sp. Urea-02u-13]